MSRKGKKTNLAVRTVARGAAALAAMKLTASVFDRLVNRAAEPKNPHLPLKADLTNRSVGVVDLHCDTLLWQRNLLQRHDYGQVDLPRLRAGGVCLQVFGAVTRIPADINFESTHSRLDVLPALAVAQLWPARSWFSPYQRALYLARRLDDFVRQSQGGLMWVRTRQDLERLIQRRAAGDSVVGAFLCLEGAHGLGDDLANLDVLFARGYRMLGLAHFFDNRAAGSAHGAQKGGLTGFGRALVAAAAERGMLLDLAHASPRTFAEALEICRGPLLVSHTGVRGTYDSPRNLSDAQLEQIAAREGLVGIAFFKEAVGGESLRDVVEAIHYTCERIGVEHVAIGSDFDGVVHTPIDAAGFGRLARALLSSGISAGDVEQIMGGNALRFLGRTLPDGS
jgi:membrane dipeptidase